MPWESTAVASPSSSAERSGVPAMTRAVTEEGVPEFLWRHVPDQVALETLPENQRFGGETSAKQVFDRLAGACDAPSRRLLPIVPCSNRFLPTSGWKRGYGVRAGSSWVTMSR